MPSMRFAIKQSYGSVEIAGFVFVCLRWEGEEWELGFEAKVNNGVDDNCHFYRFWSLIFGQRSRYY